MGGGVRVPAPHPAAPPLSSRKSLCQRLSPSLTHFLPLLTHLGCPPPAPPPPPRSHSGRTRRPPPGAQPPRARGSPCSLLPPGWEVTCWLAAFSLPLEGKGQRARSPLCRWREAEIVPQLAEGNVEATSPVLPRGMATVFMWLDPFCRWGNRHGAIRLLSSLPKPTRSWGLTLPSPDHPGHGIGVRERGLGGGVLWGQKPQWQPPPHISAQKQIILSPLRQALPGLLASSCWTDGETEARNTEATRPSSRHRGIPNLGSNGDTWRQGPRAPCLLWLPPVSFWHA